MSSFFTKRLSSSLKKTKQPTTAKPPATTKPPSTTKPQVKPVLGTLTAEYKQLISSHSKLGKKGYTLPLSLLSKEDVDFLRTDLFLKPVVAGVKYGGGGDSDDAFPVFRENSNKMYIPRFYGIQRYGLPATSEVSPGDTISLTFDKDLRDYQEKIIKIYTDYVDAPVCSAGGENQCNGGGAILEVPCGRGKTVMALKIISLLSKKTLILVHKEFLMNQWIERIAEFLPGARVGKIQADVFDIENKDIVLGMIQTMYKRDFENNAFASFGLTIIDEVHRIGSEEFSKTLLKTVTPYMLGISATVDRKDKLTKLLYMFIGNKIYEESREDEDPVCVRGIQYKTNDTEFNSTEYDYRGNPKYSTMITKLCAYGPRSDFIVRIVGDLLKEHPGSQIMILAHNRSLLTYLYTAIEHHQIATVGYYVGGMKQAKLQETEGKQIVLATYAMAAEALDIKTLSMLIMVTPKTDIIQSVGRILRVKHENPVIVDIIDSHDIFQNQWRSRKTFYRKCNYRIRTISSVKYAGMQIDWENDATWTRDFEPKKAWAPKNDEDSDEDGGKSLANRKCLIAMDNFDEEK